MDMSVKYNIIITDIAMDHKPKNNVGKTTNIYQFKFNIKKNSFYI